MYKEYDRSLHSPLKWQTMESPAQELDEDKLDADIADLIGAQMSDEEKCETLVRPGFPSLISQEDVAAHDAEKAIGLSGALRQKWAELSGAA
jgi:hypothetical protein